MPPQRLPRRQLQLLVRQPRVQLSIEQSDDDEDQNDHQQNVNQIARLWDARNARRTKVPEEPED